MMRRGIGVSKAIKAKQQRDVFQEKGAQLTESKLSDMRLQLKKFKEQLELFAVKHANKLNSDPEFRNKFQKMCTTIGVDPLSSSKGFWSEMLGVGQFFYELGVQILHICLATSDINGGMMQLSQLQSYLQKLREKNGVKSNHEKMKTNMVVTEDDVRRAVALLEPLGNGVKFVQVGKITMLISVPLELSSDHTNVLDVAYGNGGSVSVDLLEKQLNWDCSRIDRAMQLLQSQGITWVDFGSPDNKALFWFPSIRLSILASN